MERTMLAWNLPNWITVILMAAAGYAVLAVVGQWIVKPGSKTAGGGAF